MDPYKPYFAETFATFALVFVGCGAIVVDQISGGAIGHVGVALAFGLVVMCMIYAIGDVSGAHLNPAVTLGFYVAGRFPARRIPPYVAAQCLGAIAAAALLRGMFGNYADLGATLPAGAASQSLVLEAILTCLLMVVILSVATGAKEKGFMAGIAIGGTVALNALWAGPISGASMNPARTLGPAVMAGQLGPLWLYIVGPCVGAALAVAVCRAVHQKGECCVSHDDETPPAALENDPVRAANSHA